MTTPLDKIYQPQNIEQQWYQRWESQGYFQPSGKGDPYCIMLPPPNVTGSLHMGHGFGFTIMDVLVRYERMSGKNTLWQPGTDHAGIATQMVVERQLNQENKTRHDLGREDFVKKVWEWKEESGGTITKQLRRLGASLDWDRECFTLDEDLCYAVRDVFIRLYEEGLIYRGERLVNWDPQMGTAVSDLEVINEETEGKLWHIRYPLVGKPGHLIVATTRPETLLGDVAVAVHPDDERFQSLIGMHVTLPLTDREIPIIADNYVDPLFGTGCVKITPAHDFNDFAVGARHALTPINIFTPSAHLNDNVPEGYRGLERFAAREKILADLTAAGLIEKIEKHMLKVPRGEKSNAVIEPYLTKQWFLKMQSLAAPAIAAVEKGEIRFIPDNWDKTYYQWMNNIEDWCISRQLWWGHRIPIWYDEAGNPYAGQDEQAVRARHQLGETVKLKQEEDVLDTWFSAALWPFSTLGWPKETPALHTFFPTSVLITGFDIIFFWVARMIMMSLKFTGQIPFKDIYITGLIRDADGHKMSKSKGNVLDPIDLIDGIDLDKLVQKRIYGLMQPSMREKIEENTRKEFPNGIDSYGTDALRFTFCSVASYTREIRFDVNRLSGYRSFCNKLWNAARYVMMNTENQDTGITGEKKFSTPDILIRSCLQKTIAEAHTALSLYRFDLFAQVLYDFTWNIFCDWYLEFSKPVLNSPDSTPESLRGTRYTLVTVLETLLRLLHPIMPFITEEIWQRLKPLTGQSGDSIMLMSYPVSDSVLVDEETEATLNWVQQLIIKIRTVRSEMNIAPGKLLPIAFRNHTHKELDYIGKEKHLLLNLARIESIRWLERDETPPPSATTLLGELEIFIPLSSFIDPKEEAQRLTREIEKLDKELLSVRNKLENPQFVERAPADVILKEREKQKEAEAKLQKLHAQLKSIQEAPFSRTSGA